MATDRLNIDEFCSGLTAELAGVLAEGDDGSPALAVVRAAEVAEAACVGRPLACGVGCPHCCVLNVAVLLPEAKVIAGFLQRELTTPNMEMLRQKLASHASWVRWMDDEERIARSAFCPLLDEAGRCVVHPVRPLACRGVASLDSAGCREAFDPIISERERFVIADLLRRMVYDEAFRSLALALKGCGLDDRSIDLVDGIRLFLEPPLQCEQS